jgi:peptide alpha-N-acetyltransferase
MALFSKEGNELNVHDMQCMWYEIEVGNSYLRQGNYRLALKNFHFIERHLEQINEDQTDFHLYAIRKYTITAYFQMLDMMENIYRNRNAVRAALGIIKTMSKVQMIREEEEKQFEPEFEAYKNSDDYKKLMDEIKKRDDDDDYRLDNDPKGFELYEKSV